VGRSLEHLIECFEALAVGSVRSSRTTSISPLPVVRSHRRAASPIRPETGCLPHPQAPPGSAWHRRIVLDEKDSGRGIVHGMSVRGYINRVQRMPETAGCNSWPGMITCAQ